MPTIEVEEPVQKAKPWVKVTWVAVAAVVAAVVAGTIWQIRVAADQTAYRQTLAQQNIAGLTKDYTGAIAKWEKYRHGPWPRNYYYLATLNEASLYQTLHKNPEALALYRLAEPKSKGKDTAAYEGIASISEDMGDYATAIKYYQKEESIYATMNIGTSEWGWMHTHIEMLKQKEAAKNATK